MKTTTEKQTAKPKQVPDFYIFENGANGAKGSKRRYCSSADRHSGR